MEGGGWRVGLVADGKARLEEEGAGEQFSSLTVSQCSFGHSVFGAQCRRTGGPRERR